MNKSSLGKVRLGGNETAVDYDCEGLKFMEKLSSGALAHGDAVLLQRKQLPYRLGLRAYYLGS